MEVDTNNYRFRNKTSKYITIQYIVHN